MAMKYDDYYKKLSAVAKEMVDDQVEKHNSNPVEVFMDIGVMQGQWDWCKENLIARVFVWFSVDWVFENENDALMFKLRWL
jgi:hypothetical protein